MGKEYSIQLFDVPPSVAGCVYQSVSLDNPLTDAGIKKFIADYENSVK